MYRSKFKWIRMPWKSITSSKEKFTELVAQNVAKNRMVSGGFLEEKLYFPWILSNFAENILHSICIILA